MQLLRDQHRQQLQQLQAEKEAADAAVESLKREMAEAAAAAERALQDDRAQRAAAMEQAQENEASAALVSQIAQLEAQLGEVGG
jgi:hypothetical protein